MHEMSIAASLLSMAREEAAKSGCARLVSVTVRYGQISGIMPEALQFAFEALTSSTVDEGAKLVLEKVPLKMRCVFCRQTFEPDEASDGLAPCPGCGEIFGHVVEQGRELLLARIEAVAEKPEDSPTAG